MYNCARNVGHGYSGEEGIVGPFKPSLSPLYLAAGVGGEQGHLGHNTSIVPLYSLQPLTLAPRRSEMVI